MLATDIPFYTDIKFSLSDSPERVMVKLIGKNGFAISTLYKGDLANYFLKGRDSKYLNVKKSMEAIYRCWIWGKI